MHRAWLALMRYGIATVGICAGYLAGIVIFG
jgi:hypothetical protein